jgi:protein-glutamine gamma-glutamyltransferase
VIKVVLAVGLVVALARFLRSVGVVATVDEARVPLASLFLWVQVLHAFDVPRRRDLAFSMVSSTTLIAVAGALALTGDVVVLVLVWAGLAAAWLWLSSRPRADQVRPAAVRRRIVDGHGRWLAPARSAATAGVAALVVGSLLFVAMPRLPSGLVRTPPFSLGDGAQRSADPGTITNPGLPTAGADGIVDFALGGYPGFSAALDLRARGSLSDELAFRVRAEAPSLWRADAFDTFDGQIWTASPGPLAPVQAVVAGEGAARVPPPAFGAAPDDVSHHLVQTF